MIVKMFQVDIQIDQEAHKIVLRNPAGQELDITNCVQRHEVDIDGTAYLSVVATTRKCSYKAEPKETARACSLHPDQPAVFRRAALCDCGLGVLALALCQWCKDNLSEEVKADLSLRNYEIGSELHKSGQVHQEWAARLQQTLTVWPDSEK